MEPTLQSMGELFVDKLNSLVTPVLVLVVGWLGALLLAWFVRFALRQFRFDYLIAEKALGEEQGGRFDSARWISKAVYAIALLFVVVAFFQTLGLTAASEPIKALLENVLVYLPRILAGGALIVVAWMVATVLRTLLGRSLRRLKLDERAADTVGVDASLGDERPSLSKTVAETTYWLTFLLFLPAVLGTLGLQGLLEPVQALVDELLGFLPNLLSAGLLLLIGWFTAVILERIVTNFLGSVGLDGLAKRYGFDQALGTLRLSSLIGLLVKVVVLIPVAISALDALQLTALTEPASRMLETLLAAIPAVFGALVVLGVAFVGGRAVASVVENLLTGLGFDRILEKLGLSAASPGGFRNTPAKIIAGLLLVGIMLFAAIAAANLLGLGDVAALLNEFTVLAGRVLLGLAIFGVGLYLANLAAQALAESTVTQARVLSVAARSSIVILAGAMGLRQMGLANEIIELGFGLIVGAIAVAAAIAFGIGGREAASKAISEWTSRLGEGGPKGG